GELDRLPRQAAWREHGPRRSHVTFRYGDSFQIANELQGYERLLHDTMLGDQTLFTSADGIERALGSRLAAARAPAKPLPYAAGSWGPDAIDQLVAPYQWHRPYH